VSYVETRCSPRSRPPAYVGAARGFRFARALFVALAVSLSACMVPTPVEQAQALVRQNRPEEAAKKLRERLTSHPDDLASRGLLIRIDGLLGRLDLARKDADLLAARVGPTDPRPKIEMGHAFELAHEYEQAIASYDEAAAMDPKSPAGPREAGLRAARWGEVELALPRLLEAVRRGADDAEVLHALALAQVHERLYEDAERTYRTTLARHPDAVENWLGLATLALVKKDYASALSAYESLARRRPDSTQASLGRAYALAKLGRREEATRELAHAEALGAPAAYVAKQRAALATPPAPVAPPASPESAPEDPVSP
jgi:tetratricopeptide (TPR) repeat protein